MHAYTPAGSQATEKYTSQEIEEALGELERTPSHSSQRQSAENTQSESTRTHMQETLPVETAHPSETVGTQNDDKEKTAASERSQTYSEELSAIEPSQTVLSTTVSSHLVVEMSQDEYMASSETKMEVETVATGDIEKHKDVGTTSAILMTSSEIPPHTSEMAPSKPDKDTSVPHKPVSVSSLASESGGAVFRKESTSSGEFLLSPTPEGTYRYRSISDVSHSGRKLTSYRTEGSVSSASLRDSEEAVKVKFCFFGCLGFVGNFLLLLYIAYVCISLSVPLSHSLSHSFSFSFIFSLTHMVSPLPPPLSPPPSLPPSLPHLSLPLSLSPSPPPLSLFPSLPLSLPHLSLTQDQPAELHGVPLKQSHGGKKRNVVSVADPTDILTNLHLIPLDQSSELTQVCVCVCVCG